MFFVPKLSTCSFQHCVDNGIMQYGDSVPEYCTPSKGCSIVRTFFFLSCKANARVKLAKTGHGPHSTTLVSIFVVRMLLLMLFGCYLCCSMYYLCVNVYCHRVTT
jgi:hypothetical protein